MGKKHKQYKPAQTVSGNGGAVQNGSAMTDELAQLKADKDRLEIEKSELEARLQPYLDVVDKAKHEAEELIDLVKSDEAQIREKARREQELAIAHLLTTAQEDAETLRANAKADEARIRQDAETEASSTLDAARKALEDAKTEATRIAAEAADEISVRRAALEKEYADRVQQALDQLRKDQNELSARQEAIAARERTAQKEDQRLAILRDDLEFDVEGVQLRRGELEKRWNQCSPDRLWMLERQVESEQRKNESLAVVVKDLQAQCDRFRRDQENMAGRSAGSLLSELESMRVRYREMSDRLASLPCDEELSALRMEASELRVVREQRDELDRQLRAQLEAAARVELGMRELNQAKIEADALRVLNDELQKQLEANAKALTQRTGACFPELIRIDSEWRRRPTRAEQFSTAEGRLLSALVTHVRTYAASSSEKPLYYSDADIRTFIAGLATSPFMLLQGLSGTGKTSLPRVFAEAIVGEHRKISVQSNWRDRHELLGYYNDFNKRFTETEFTQALYTAALPSEEEVPWFIVLDEVNLARVEYYFADFLSVLEQQDRGQWMVELMSFDPTADGTKGPAHLAKNRMLEIPGNVWFIGTANQDESTFEITDKVYDRAQVIDFRERHSKNGGGGRASQRRVALGKLLESFDEAKAAKAYQLTEQELGYLGRLDSFLVSAFDVTFGNRILDQIKSFVPVYVASGGTKSEAFDIQFARKILRKLENLHEPSARQSLDRLSEEMASLPRGWDTLTISAQAVERITKRCI